MGKLGNWQTSKLRKICSSFLVCQQPQITTGQTGKLANSLLGSLPFAVCPIGATFEVCIFRILANRANFRGKMTSKKTEKKSLQSNQGQTQANLPFFAGSKAIADYGKPARKKRGGLC